MDTSIRSLALTKKRNRRATFDNGYTKKINVAHDSGIAMIRDIIKGLG